MFTQGYLNGHYNMPTFSNNDLCKTACWGFSFHNHFYHFSLSLSFPVLNCFLFPIIFFTLYFVEFSSTFEFSSFFPPFFPIPSQTSKCSFDSIFFNVFRVVLDHILYFGAYISFCMGSKFSSTQNLCKDDNGSSVKGIRWSHLFSLQIYVLCMYMHLYVHTHIYLVNIHAYYYCVCVYIINIFH